MPVPAEATLITNLNTLRSYEAYKLLTGGATTLEGVIAALVEISGGTGGTATTPADIGAGIDLSTDVDSIITLLTGIQTALTNQQDIETNVLVDANDEVFVQRLQRDHTTGNVVVSNVDPTGAAFVPALPVKAPAGDTPFVTVQSQFLASAAGAGYAIGDVLQLTRLSDNTETWYNVTQLSAIAVPAPADIGSIDDEIEPLLQAISTTLTNIENLQGAPSFWTATAAETLGTPVAIGDRLVRVTRADGSSSWFLDDGTALTGSPTAPDLLGAADAVTRLEATGTLTNVNDTVELDTISITKSKSHFIVYETLGILAAESVGLLLEGRRQGSTRWASISVPGILTVTANEVDSFFGSVAFDEIRVRLVDQSSSGTVEIEIVVYEGAGAA